jgi:extradiol dioxygenase family protein
MTTDTITDTAAGRADGFSSPSIFHLAIHVGDLDRARDFYGRVLGCAEGRSTDTWVDFDFFGHQLSLHRGEPFATAATGRVGDKMVPMPHFGIVLLLPQWEAMAERLRAAGTDFVLEPQVRFAGEPGEQRTMFFRDPFGNPIEVKGFRTRDAVYAA